MMFKINKANEELGFELKHFKEWLVNLGLPPERLTQGADKFYGQKFDTFTTFRGRSSVNFLQNQERVQEDLYWMARSDDAESYFGGKNFSFQSSKKSRHCPLSFD
jgi:hypothetical protein